MRTITYRDCTMCEGTGRNADAPDPTTRCWGCWGHVKVPSNIPDVLPPREEFLDGRGDTHFIPRELRQELADSFTYLVVRQDRPGTWAEYNLGTGGIWSTTDYGEAWRQDNDAALASKVKAKIAEGHEQWCKFYNRETRRKADVIVVQLHQHGYTPIAVDLEQGLNVSASSTAMLPPTYTNELLRSNPHA